jgi:hypothetical protein
MKLYKASYKGLYEIDMSILGGAAGDEEKRIQSNAVNRDIRTDFPRKISYS